MLGHYFFGIAIFLTSVFLVLLVLVQRGRGGGLVGALGGPAVKALWVPKPVTCSPASQLWWPRFGSFCVLPPCARSIQATPTRLLA